MLSEKNEKLLEIACNVFASSIIQSKPPWGTERIKVSYWIEEWITDQIRSDQSLSRVWLFATPWITACQSVEIICLFIHLVRVVSSFSSYCLKFILSLPNDLIACFLFVSKHVAVIYNKTKMCPDIKSFSYKLFPRQLCIHLMCFCIESYCGEVRPNFFVFFPLASGG